MFHMRLVLISLLAALGDAATTQLRSKRSSAICQLGSESCNYWQVANVLLLAPESTHLTQIESFIEKVNANCDSRSESLLLTRSSINDTNACDTFAMNSSAEKSEIENININDATVENGTALTTLISLLDIMFDCTADNSLKSGQAGAIFAFIDVSPCEMLAELDDDSRANLAGVTAQLIELRYFLQFNVISSDSKDRGCAATLFSPCLQAAASSCSIDVFTSSEMSAKAAKQTTCPASTIDTTDYTLVIVLSIVVPCFSIACICVVCAVLCYKKSRYNFNSWRKYWHKELAKQPNSPITEIPPFPPSPCQELLSPKELQRRQYLFEPLPAVAVANQYMDISSLVEANRKADVWEVSRQNLLVHEDILIGNGAFANVFKGTLSGKIPLLSVHDSLNLVLEHQRDGYIDVALKRLPAHADEDSRRDFMAEIEFMKKVGYHHHVISMIGCVSCTIDPLILLEFCENGDLLKFLRKRRSEHSNKTGDRTPQVEAVLRIKDLVSFAWQISDGLEYLASQKFIHRDIAARNILLTKGLVAKISDFGLCRYVDSLYTAKGGRLPIKWMALESLKFYEYSTKSDVWAYGVLLFEIFSLGDGPYPAIQPLDMLKHLESGNRLPQPERCPKEIYELMTRCWKEHLDDRPTFTEIRSELMLMLNLNDAHYGYLDVSNARAAEFRELRRVLDDEIFPDGGRQVAVARRKRRLLREDEILEVIQKESMEIDDEQMAGRPRFERLEPVHDGLSLQNDGHSVANVSVATTTQRPRSNSASMLGQLSVISHNITPILKPLFTTRGWLS